jgi:hypothetical protein
MLIMTARADRRKLPDYRRAQSMHNVEWVYHSTLESELKQISFQAPVDLK